MKNEILQNDLAAVQKLKYYRDYRNVLATARQEGYEEGYKEGFKMGL